MAKRSALEINVWTGSWAWSAGVAATVLVAAWAAFEVRRSAGPDRAPATVRVDREATDLSGSELLGVERGDPGVPVDVRQVVRGSGNSRIVGLGSAGD